MKAVEKIREHLKKIQEGETFTTGSFRHLASEDNVRQILNRLIKNGEIKRLSRGVFVKPKYIPQVGEVLPLVQEIAETIAKSTGEKIAIHGAEAARQLQLTTQMPMRLIMYTTGNTREIKIKNQSVLLKHVSPSKLIATGTIAGIVITALLYLGQEQVTIETLKKIQNRLTNEEFDTVLKEVNHMPAWMANIFYYYQKERFHE